MAAVVLLGFRALACFAPAGWGLQARLLPTVLAALILVAHVLLEGWRWQMIPAYAAVVLLVLIDVGRLAMQSPEVQRHPLRAVLGLIGVAVVAALPTFLPMPRLAEPVGPSAAIGTMDGQIFDVTRDRPLPVRVWYPTNDPSGSKASWLGRSDIRLPLLATRAGLPSWFLSHARLFAGNAVSGAALAPAGNETGAWPVVVFSHGRGGFKEQNTFLAEALASNGYLVIAPDHTGGAFATSLDDGSVVEFDPGLFGDGQSQQEQDAAVRELGVSWALDASAVLDALAAGETGTSLGPINIARVVAIGQSTGAGAMFEFCFRDSRCSGVAGLDAWMLPTSEQALSEGVDAPVLGLFGHSSFGFFEPINHQRFAQMATATQQQGSPTRDVMIAGANHLDFSDGALLSPWGHLLGQDTGPIDAHRAFELINAEVVWFADQVATGSTGGATEPAGTYPDPYTNSDRPPEIEPWRDAG